MNFKEDFSKLKKDWEVSTSLTKFFISTSFIVSILSVGSISDAVFNLHGFVKTAILFYQSITEPLFIFFQKYLEFDFVQSKIDTILLILLSSSVLIRKQFSLNNDNVNLLEVIVIISLIYFVIYSDKTYGVFLMYLLYIIGNSFLPKYLTIFHDYISQDLVFAYKAAFYKIIAIFLTFGFIAGVSEGIDRILKNT